MAGQLLFYYIVVCRSLPGTMGLECCIFGPPWCFTSAKGVSSISAKSLIQECVCIPVAIFDPFLVS
jgi:hypothetical protein